MLVAHVIVGFLLSIVAVPIVVVQPIGEIPCLALDLERELQAARTGNAGKDSDYP